MTGYDYAAKKLLSSDSLGERRDASDYQSRRQNGPSDRVNAQTIGGAARKVLSSPRILLFPPFFFIGILYGENNDAGASRAGS